MRALEDYRRLGVAGVSLSERRVSGFKGERLEIAVDVKGDARATGLQDWGCYGASGLKFWIWKSPPERLGYQAESCNMQRAAGEAGEVEGMLANALWDQDGCLGDILEDDV